MKQSYDDMETSDTEKLTIPLSIGVGKMGFGSRVEKSKHPQNQ